MPQGAQPIWKTAGRPENPNVHHWPTADAETILQRERETAAKRTVRADPRDPL